MAIVALSLASFGCRGPDPDAYKLGLFNREVALDHRGFQVLIAPVGPSYFWIDGCGRELPVHPDSWKALAEMERVANRSTTGMAFTGVLSGRVVTRKTAVGSEGVVLVEKVESFRVGDYRLRDALRDRIWSHPDRKDAQKSGDVTLN